MTRSLVAMVLVAVMVSMVAGCAVYSEQRYGPQNVGSVNTITECLRKAGGPDVMHSTATQTVFVYRTVDAMQVLGIFGTVKKQDRVLVFDGTGKQVGDEVVDKGSGMFILGTMCPAFEVE